MNNFYLYLLWGRNLDCIGFHGFGFGLPTSRNTVRDSGKGKRVILMKRETNGQSGNEITLVPPSNVKSWYLQALDLQVQVQIQVHGFGFGLDYIWLPLLPAAMNISRPSTCRQNFTCLDGRVVKNSCQLSLVIDKNEFYQKVVQAAWHAMIRCV